MPQAQKDSPECNTPSRHSSPAQLCPSHCHIHAPMHFRGSPRHCVISTAKSRVQTTRRLGVCNITQKRTPGSTKHARRGFPCQAAASHTYPCGLGATMMASKLQGQVACSRGKLLTVTAANQPTTPLALPGLSVTVPNHRVPIFI